jgi:hypothetical protein
MIVQVGSGRAPATAKISAAARPAAAPGRRAADAPEHWLSAEQVARHTLGASDIGRLSEQKQFELLAAFIRAAANVAQGPAEEEPNRPRQEIWKAVQRLRHGEKVAGRSTPQEPLSAYVARMLGFKQK